MKFFEIYTNLKRYEMSDPNVIVLSETDKDKTEIRKQMEKNGWHIFEIKEIQYDELPNELKGNYKQ